jgi:hypothetical protein
VNPTATEISDASQGKLSAFWIVPVGLVASGLALVVFLSRKKQ